MKWLKFKVRYSAGWKGSDGKQLFRSIPNALVDIPTQVEDEFAAIALKEGVAEVCDPGDVPAIPAPHPLPKADKMERGEAEKGRRTK